MRVVSAVLTVARRARAGYGSGSATRTGVLGLLLLSVVTSLVTWGLLVSSWAFLVLRSRLVRGYSLSLLRSLELCSVVLAVVAHTLLMHVAVHGRFPSPAALCSTWRCGARHGVTRGTRVEKACNGSGSDGDRDDDTPDRESARVSAVATLLGSPVSATLRTQRQGGRAFAAATDAKGRRGGAGSPGSTPESRALFTTSKGGAGGMGEGYTSLLDSAGPSSRALQERLVAYLPAAVGGVAFVVACVHLVVNQTIPEAHRQSKEIILTLVRVCLDVALAVTCDVFMALRLEKVASRSSRMSGVGRVSRVRLVLVAVLAAVAVGALYALGCFLALVVQSDTMAALRLGVTADVVDVCELEGLRMHPALARSWVWPALMHRRFFNFWTGSEACAPSGRPPPISFVEGRERVLLVSPVCVDGERPHVYLHRPENNEFSGSDDVGLPESERGNHEYHRQLEALYGTTELAAARGVIVHRDATSKLITAVEVDPATLSPQRREPETPLEKDARQRWPTAGRGEVLRVRLGRSPAYTVYCASMNHEEYHVSPLDDSHLDTYTSIARGSEAACVPQSRRRQGDSGVGATSTADDADVGEPAGNVLMVLIDAVSRQAMRRSLPMFVRALTGLNDNSSTGGHMVVEAHGATTLGVNTAANLVPFFAGISARAFGLENESKFTNVSFANRTVFALAKRKYGDAVSTALTTASCQDLFEFLIGYTVPNSGAGGRAAGVDRYLYMPFCHLDYSGYSSNFRGPYSIVPRCMAGESVSEHTLRYAEQLLTKQMRDGERARTAALSSPLPSVVEGDCGAAPEMRGRFGKNFFHVVYMTDGHEGTHGVLPLLDATLARFFTDLRDKMRFFDNPLNTFIVLSDHGNHMGHYYEYTNAGKFERGTPPLVMAVSPTVLSRVDKAKGRASGTSLANLQYRLRRLSTSLDVYPTLGDLLNVSVSVYEKYNAPGIMHAASLFDLRDEESSAFVRSCSQLSTAIEQYPCPLDYCIAR
ncbi:hypothetical protein NESM_000768600 [Novymonas esmeraldas]|uniref:Sulfatase N-terminal domain-containing protein n=1 Tax=Novymonas esmeraldas TaxID=1808958 RepID=A0AAW0EV68_9TRYP